MPADEDDLTLIRGIGPVRKAWLRERLAVRTFADLAALDVNRARQALTGRPSAPSEEEVARWVRDARRFAGQGQLAPDAMESMAPVQDWASVSTFIIDFLSQSKPDGQHAFKTLAEQMEPDAPGNQTREEWGGIETQAPHAWMVWRLRTTLASRGFSLAMPDSSPVAPDPSQLRQGSSRSNTRVEAAAPTAGRLDEPAARAVLEQIELRAGHRRDQFASPFSRREALRVGRDMPISIEVAFSVENKAPLGAATNALCMASLRLLDPGSERGYRVCSDSLYALPPSGSRNVAVVRLESLPPGRYLCWISIAAMDFSVRPVTARIPNLLIE